MVDDCSDDNTWILIEELSRVDCRLCGFKLSRNFGQHNAITAGLNQASGAWVVIMDCDLQDKPEDIRRLIEKTNEGFEVVIARSTFREDAWLRRLASYMFNWCFSLISGHRHENGVRPFRIMSRRLVEVLLSMREQTRTLSPLMELVGFRSAYIDVGVEKRYAGQSSYSWGRLLKVGLDTAIAFSSRPLYLSICIGFTMAVTAFTYGVYIFLLAVMQEITIPGWTSLIISLYLIGGLILFNLGIMGLYLSKVFEEVKARPLYLIAQTTRKFHTPDSKFVGGGR
jgi:dolichol-phosphate mannosyltransferase